MSDHDSAVVDNLVTQFSSPLHCFRELVQNSIDAGSPTVDVWTEFIEGDGHEGTIALHVDDYGEGMDEAIIDEELTRLFASSKEEDLTKIGQFGIGFVSTFALEPEAILVKTGRSGEYWEVLFREDKSFTKTELDVPVEGTQITIFRSGDRHEYGELADDIHRTLRRWCNHSDTEVTFENRTPADGGRPEKTTVNEPFEVEGDCHRRVEHEGTVIAVAYNPDPRYGFYNRGLTLALTENGDDILDERRAQRLSHVRFKVKSRYLEHTLSRETVMRDANYEKAMRMLEAAVDGPLFSTLVDEIENLVRTQQWSHAEMDRYRRLVGYLAREPTENIKEVVDRPLFRLVDGDRASLSTAYEAWKRDGRVLVADGPTDLAVHLLAEGIPVFLDGFPAHSTLREDRTPVSSIVSGYIRRQHEASLVTRFYNYFDIGDTSIETVTAPDDVYRPVVVDDEIPDAIEPLLQNAAELLDSIGAGYASLHSCVMGSPEANAPLFVLARNLDTVMARPPDAIAETRAERRPHAAVNRDHAHFQTLLELDADQPELAAYCLAKSLLLTEDRLLEDDARLIQSAAGVS